MSAAIRVAGQDPKEFVVPERRLEALQATYAGSIVPVDVNNLRDDGIVAPVVRRRPGRPKKKRYLASFEKGPRKAGKKKRRDEDQ